MFKRSRKGNICHLCSQFHLSYPQMKETTGKIYHLVNDKKVRLRCAFSASPYGDFTNPINCQTVKLLRFLCGENNRNPVGNMTKSGNRCLGALPVEDNGFIVLAWKEDSHQTNFGFFIKNGVTVRFNQKVAESALNSYASHWQVTSYFGK